MHCSEQTSFHRAPNQALEWQRDWCRGVPARRAMSPRRSGRDQLMNKYGVIDPSPDGKQDSQHLERLRIKGFSVVPEILSAAELEECRKRLDAVYELQLQEFGADRLSAINESDLARSPLSYDPSFLDIALNGIVLDIVRGAIGGGYISPPFTKWNHQPSGEEAPSIVVA